MFEPASRSKYYGSTDIMRPYATSLTDRRQARNLMYPSNAHE